MGNTLRRVPKSGATTIYDPYAKRKMSITHEVEEQNYRQAFTLYCGECLEAYELQAGKLANRRVGKCGICSKEGFLVGNMGNDDGKVHEARFRHNAKGVQQKGFSIIDRWAV